MIRLLALFALTLYCIAPTYAQTELAVGPYLLVDTTTLFQRLNRIERTATAAADAPYRTTFATANAERSETLKSKVLDGLFIFNEPVTSQLTGTFSELIEANDLRLDPLVFISRSPSMNAASYGDGLFVINVGLLEGLTTREQLAYVLAHELAHDQLLHRYDQLLQRAVVQAQRDAHQPKGRRGRRRERSTTSRAEAREQIYEQHRHSRARELEADSLAIVYLAGAGLPTTPALRALERLNRDSPFRLPAGTVGKHLHTEAYPFKPSWTEEEETMFGGAFGGTTPDDDTEDFWQRDSLTTHPQLDQRTTQLKTLIGELDTLTDYQNSPHAEWAIREIIQSHLHAELPAQALILAMKELNEAGPDDYFAASIVDALVITHRAIYEQNFDGVVPPSRFFADEGAGAVVRMLQSMRAGEIKRMILAYAAQQLKTYPDSAPLRAAHDRAKRYFLD